MKLTTKISLALAIVTTAAGISKGAILYDNSNITTGVANGFNGANTSVVDQAHGYNNYGFTDNSVGASSNELAQSFSIGAASALSTITFDVYSSGTYPTTPTSPITGATVTIYNQAPASFGAVKLFTSSILASTAWTGVYRVATLGSTDATRPVFTVSVGFAGLTLPAGSYWAAFDVTGVTSPGTTSLFTPPVMNTDGTTVVGNGEFTPNGGNNWGGEEDTGPISSTGGGIFFPLTVTGTVPEPTTLSLLVLSSLGLLRRRRVAKI